MSGKRCKSLRREFKEKTGCAPAAAVIETTPRRLRWLRGIFNARQTLVVTLSEWRQLKKAHLRQRSRKA